MWRRPPAGRFHTGDYLRKIGTAEIRPATSPFDPGYDPVTVEGHLEQSSHLMLTLKISMACWMIANKNSTRQKVTAARKHGVPTVTAVVPLQWRWRRGSCPPTWTWWPTSASPASSAVRASPT